jgi:TolC family type I secretion outer membrane protein
MQRWTLFPWLFLLLISVPAGAQQPVKAGDTLDLQQCIEIALKNHPNIMAAKSTIDANQNLIGQAESNYYPQVNASTGYNRVNQKVSNLTLSGGGTSISNIAVDRGALNQYANSFSVSQNIYDFGKTPTRVRIQKLNRDASQSDFDNVSDNVELNVKHSYYGFLRAMKNRDVAVENVRQFEHHLQQAKGFYEVGTRPKFDVTKAEVDLSSAKLALIRAENAFKVARVNLNNAMGLPYVPLYSIQDNLYYEKYGVTMEEALDRAFRNRPDLKSFATQEEAGKESIELAKKGHYPELTGNGNYNFAGEEYPLDRNWNTGVILNIPIFSGLLTTYQVKEARSNLNVLKANMESLKQQILLEVKEAHLNLLGAEEAIPTAELAVRQATENLELANGRYQAGVGDPIEVTDAEVAYANAQFTYIQALYDYRIAQANLEKAMGATQQ